MSDVQRLKTKRLILRQWRTKDYVPFAALNDDPQVMEFYPKTLTREESDAFAEGHPLRTHVLYNLTRAQWAKTL